MKNIPSTEQLTLHAEVLNLLFGQDDDIWPNNIFDAALVLCEVPLSQISPFLVWSCLHPECGGYVPLRTCDEARFPQVRHLRVLYSQFLVALQTTLTIPKDEHMGRRLWALGAFGRSIRLFPDSNMITFDLIENRLRLEYGLPWRIHCHPKSLYDSYYEKVFKKHFAWAFGP